MSKTMMYTFVFILFSLSNLTLVSLQQYSQCSINPACGRFQTVANSDNSICGVLFLTCSELVSCVPSKNFCYQPGHICVHHPRCFSHPICYPSSMADQRICPRKETSNITTTMKTTAVPSRPGDGICALATWAQNATTVAGGNGEGSELNQFYIPHGLFVDHEQSIYVADFNNHRIVKWDRGMSSGQLVAGGKGHGSDSDHLDSPMDVFVDRNETMYISDRNNDRVLRWPRDAQSGETIIKDIFPVGIAQDDQGSLYVSDDINHEVRKWRIGDTVGQLITSDVFSPGSLFVDQDLSVYVADGGNHRVIKVDNGITQVSIVAGGSLGDGDNQLGYPDSVIVDQLGTVYVADTDNNRIMRWPRGAISGSLIAGGHGQGFQPHQLWGPSDLAFDLDGNLYVVDSKNSRVQKFAIDKSLC